MIIQPAPCARVIAVQEKAQVWVKRQISDKNKNKVPSLNPSAMIVMLLPNPWISWISQKHNLIIVLLYTLQKMEVLYNVFASSLMASKTKCANLT